MKKIELLDVDFENGREEQMGTCELCFSTIWCDNPRFLFQLEDGKTISINGYWWDWGDYHELDLLNVIDFGAWLDEQRFEDDVVFNEDWLFDLVDIYNSTVGDTGCKDKFGRPIYADSKIIINYNGVDIQGHIDGNGAYSEIYFEDPKTGMNRYLEMNDRGQALHYEVTRTVEHMDNR